MKGTRLAIYSGSIFLFMMLGLLFAFTQVVFSGSNTRDLTPEEQESLRSVVQQAIDAYLKDVGIESEYDFPSTTHRQACLPCWLLIEFDNQFRLPPLVNPSKVI